MKVEGFFGKQRKKSKVVKQEEARYEEVKIKVMEKEIK
jgi:hypothetical protein